MGAQVIGPKKLRRARLETGLDLDRVLSVDNHVWLGRVITEEGHYHVRINRDTWEYEPDNSMHWTSCRELA